MKWITRAPDNFTGTCLVTMSIGNRRWVTEGWADKNEHGDLVMMRGAIAWMPMPEHASKNPTGWLSHYRGDDFPKTEDWYLVSTMHKIPHYSDLPYGVQKLWFDSNKEVFGGNDNFVAWMPLPQPFNGRAQDRGNKGMNNESTKKPDHPCKACHYKFWWQRADGSWVCGVCHPKPNCDILEAKTWGREIKR